MQHSLKSGFKKMNKKNDYFWAYVMILPTFIGLSIFYIYPFFKSIFYSFTDLGAFGKYSIVGLENYKNLFNDQVFFKSLKNTLVYTGVSVPISIILSILVACLLNSDIKGLEIYRTLYFLPAVTMPAAVAMVWKWLYNQEFGLINSILAKFSIKGPGWLTNPKTAMISLILVSIWMTVGYNMVILLAGLQNIPRTFYEAAEIDGANSVEKFFGITIPLLTPTIFFVLVMALINAFQMFDLVFMMIRESNITIQNTQTVVYMFYKNAFILSKKGYASAIVTILFFIILIITIFQVKLEKKWVNYD